MVRPGLVVLLVVLAASQWTVPAVAADGAVRLKEIARVADVRDNPLTGYGLVVGLSGSGDTSRNRATLQSVVSALAAFGVSVAADDLSSRNVAAVMVTARLPAFAEPGQVLDVQVASTGDARSLTGGTLVLTPMYGPDQKLYALAQGALLVGGFQFEAPGAMTQRNHPTAGRIPNGATVERAVMADAGGPATHYDILLNQADFSSAQAVAEAIEADIPGVRTRAMHAGKVRVHIDAAAREGVALIAQIENVLVRPDSVARVVVNERTGTVVAGAEVRLGSVSIAHGDLRIEINTEYSVSQPGGLLVRPTDSISTVVVPRGNIEIDEPPANIVSVAEGATVADLVGALRGVRLSTRDVITILQTVKAAGALHGQLIIQ